MEEVINLVEEDEETIIFEDETGSINNNYKTAINKPQINGVTLEDNKSSGQLHLQGEMKALTNIELEELLGGI